MSRPPGVKRPAFQFYPSDWRNDPGLRLCSAAARGLWVDMLCLMHEGEPYGHLTILGRQMTAESLGKLVGESTASVKKWLAELEANDVFSRDDQGVIFSRRMIRDEAVREARATGGEAGGRHGHKGAEHGKKGGRPPKIKGGENGDGRGDAKPPLKPPPSSSSSSPSSKSSEDIKSSGGETAAVVVPIDPDKAAWDMGVKLLTGQGRMSEGAARGFIGRLLKEHPSLAAKDLLPSISGAVANQTADPQGYLKAAARGVAQRKAEPAREKRVDWV